MILGFSLKSMLLNLLDFGISIGIGIEILPFPGISISIEIDQRQKKSQYRNRYRKAGIAGSCREPIILHFTMGHG